MTDGLLGRDDAVSRVLDLRGAALDGRPAETVPIDGIAGRTLAEPVAAEADLPPHDYATMDGFAFDADGGYPLEVADAEVFPEDDPPSIGAGEAVRVATGAPLPEGANAVLKREEAALEGGRLTGPAIEPGTHVYPRGSNVAAGETLFEAGERLSPKDAVLLRDIGVEAVEAHEPFSVGVLAIGTEIHEGRQPDRDSPMLAGLAGSWDAAATIEGSVPDERGRVEARVRELAGAHDVVITAGATSVGEKDYAVSALDALGDVEFHGVAVRPGKPVAAASLPDAVAFAVPGKPLSAHTSAALVARPFFAGDASLSALEARLERDVDVPHGGFEFAVPVTLDGGAAMPLGHVDSSLPIYERTFDPSVVSQSTRATRADGFFLTSEGASEGETVDVVPYPVVE